MCAKWSRVRCLCVDTHTHTHTHIYIYIYIYIFVKCFLRLFPHNYIARIEREIEVDIHAKNMPSEAAYIVEYEFLHWALKFLSFFKYPIILKLYQGIVIQQKILAASSWKWGSWWSSGGVRYNNERSDSWISVEYNYFMS